MRAQLQEAPDHAVLAGALRPEHEQVEARMLHFETEFDCCQRAVLPDRSGRLGELCGSGEGQAGGVAVAIQLIRRQRNNHCHTHPIHSC